MTAGGQDLPSAAGGFARCIRFMPMPEFDLASLKPVIIAHFPALAPARFSLLPQGWHSTAVDVDDTWVFKFPRGAGAEAALRTEAGLLAAIRPHVAMPVPALSLIAGPLLFSRHRKLKGEHLTAAQYALLPEPARRRLVIDGADRLGGIGEGGIARVDLHLCEQRGEVPVLDDIAEFLLQHIADHAGTFGIEHVERKGCLGRCRRLQARCCGRR